MNTPTPTPRTDEATLLATDIEQGGNFNAVHVQVAQRLERELTAVTEQRDKLAEALEKAKAVYTPSSGGEYQTGGHDAICWVGQQALQSLNPDHSVDANDMIEAVKGENHES